MFWCQVSAQICISGPGKCRATEEIISVLLRWEYGRDPEKRVALPVNLALFMQNIPNHCEKAQRSAGLPTHQWCVSIFVSLFICQSDYSSRSNHNRYWLAWGRLQQLWESSLLIAILSIIVFTDGTSVSSSSCCTQIQPKYHRPGCWHLSPLTSFRVFAVVIELHQQSPTDTVNHYVSPHFYSK